MINHPAYVAVTCTTISVPAFTHGADVASKRLVGIAFLVAEVGRRSRWHFSRRAYVILAEQPETALIEWATSRLPIKAMLIGWNVDHVLVPALLAAAATASPILGRQFTSRLHRLLRCGVVDLALKHGGAGAPTLANIAADMAIYAPAWNANAVTSAWTAGAVDQIRHDLADEALAIWRTFVRSAGVTGLSAEAATDAWVLRRQRTDAVTRTSNLS